MKLHQLSLFLENRPGELRPPIQALADAGINILTLSLADTEQFGILRLVVSDWAKAAQLLEEAGYAATVTEVLAVQVPDRPGGLSQILELFDNTEINIEYMYAFPNGRGETAVLIFRFNDPDGAIERLQTAGINLVGSSEVYRRIEK